jgi:hypothetical protein
VLNIIALWWLASACIVNSPELEVTTRAGGASLEQCSLVTDIPKATAAIESTKVFCIKYSSYNGVA